MGELTARTRVAPPLMFTFRSAHEQKDAKKKLDLRNEAGERIIAGRRSTGRSAITESLLRREVAQDLENLLNTVNMASSHNLQPFEHVRHSILNYGLPDLVHRTADEVASNRIVDEIATALRDYEPRIVRESIEIARDTSIGADGLRARFIIRVDLSCEPVNVPVEFVADLEVDTGKVLIDRV